MTDRIYSRRRYLYSWLGRKVMRLARLLLSKGTSQWCWICGAAAGMGPFWAGHITCDVCADRWSRFHHPARGMVVDWRGLGRLVSPKEQWKAQHALDTALARLKQKEPS